MTIPFDDSSTVDTTTDEELCPAFQEQLPNNEADNHLANESTSPPPQQQQEVIGPTAPNESGLFGLFILIFQINFLVGFIPLMILGPRLGPNFTGGWITFLFLWCSINMICLFATEVTAHIIFGEDSGEGGGGGGGGIGGGGGGIGGGGGGCGGGGGGCGGGGGGGGGGCG